MSWLESHGAQQHTRQPEPHGLAQLSAHMPSAQHHTAGAAHDFRDKLSHAVTLGDFAAIHAVIAEGEQHHVVPKNLGTMLDIIWEPGQNTHAERLGLAAAINNAVQMAKGYNEVSDILTEAANTLPHGAVREDLSRQVPSLVAPLLDMFGALPPGRKEKAEALVGHLTAML